MDCDNFQERLSACLDRELTPAEMADCTAHIAGCEHCTEYLEQMRMTILLTGRLRTSDLTGAMREEFSALYESWRAETG